MGVPGKSPCDGCDARCCSAYSVHVTGDDAWRLAERLALPLVGFLACAPQAARTGTGFLLEPGGPPHDLLLAPARAAGQRAPCVFLRTGSEGAPRCGVYPFRPMACRRFPAARLGGRYGVRDGILCPDGGWAGHDLARLSWRVALAREEREVETFSAVVAAWNAGVGASRRGRANLLDFLDWLGDAYRWLTGWRSARPRLDRSGAAYLEQVRATLAACPPR